MAYTCHQCNTELTAGQKFCPNCGIAFEQHVPADAPAPSVVPPSPVLGPTAGNLGAKPSQQMKSPASFVGGCLVVFVVLVIIGALAGNSPKGTDASSSSGGSPASTAAPASAAAPDATVDLAVSGLTVVRDEYTRSITGVVRNNSDHKYGYAQVEINLYDKSGNVIGSTMANINNLEPGQTWKFSAPILEDAAVKFDVKEVSGF